MAALLAKLGAFCATIGQDQRKPQRKWIFDMLFGIAVCGSPMLSEIGRALDEKSRDGGPRRLIHTEKRLSRNLNSDRFDDAQLQQRHLELASTLTLRDDGEDVAVGVDYTDLCKRYANLKPGRGMEGVWKCHNGSEGARTTGYPVVQIEAHLPANNQLPLIYAPYSTQVLGHRSQNDEFLRGIRLAAPYVGSRAWWVMDRGFDRRAMFEGMDDIGVRWASRLQISTPDKVNKAERHLLLPNGEHLGTFEAALTCQDRYRLDIPAGRNRRRRGLKSVELRIGARKVKTIEMLGRTDQFRVFGPDRTLIVIWGFGRRPTVLLASEYVTGRKAIVQIIRCYIRRWKAEEATRSMKESRGWGSRLEDVRALKLRGIKRLTALVATLYLFLALLRDAAPAVVTAAVRAVRVFGPAVDIRYRLARGIGKVLDRLAAWRRHRWRRRA